MHQGTSNQIMQHTVPRTLTHIHAKEADIEAIAELTCALDKKEALVFELRRMNDDVVENVGEIVMISGGGFLMMEMKKVKKKSSRFKLGLNIHVNNM
ncbi:hypothetical protein Tco_0539693 [Tanacetum coccineum]